MNAPAETNLQALHNAWQTIQDQLTKIEAGGGAGAAQKQHARNKGTARERIAQLVDADKPVIEIGAFAGYGMYEAQGGCPAGGVIGVVAYIAGRQCVVVANDQTVKAGAWFPITGKKNLRLQEIAMENRLPVVYLVDSAGVFLPMQDEIFPDKEHFGRIFRNNARMSAMGIPQIAAVLGPCVAGGAYLPIMSDETLMVKGNGSIFLAGPYLVKAAIGEDVDQEVLGGAHTHNAISGVADYEFENETECLAYVRKLVGQMAPPPAGIFERAAPTLPAADARHVAAIQGPQNARPYDVRDIINSIADAGSFSEFKASYGQTIVCGYARVDGWSVGFVANQRTIVKTAKGEMQIGGVIYNDSADKAARFIMNCNQKKIPLVFLQDVTGFMVGTRSEHSGIIKDGAKLVNAVANSVVPKITIITGNSYGAGNYAMCGKAYDPRFIYAWPYAKIAVMGGEQAAKTLLQIQVASMKARGENLSEAEEKKMLQEITEKYQAQTTPQYAAARLWVDAIIHPQQTREIIAQSLAAANNNPTIEPFKTGVFQV